MTIFEIIWCLSGLTFPIIVLLGFIISRIVKRITEEVKKKNSTRKELRIEEKEKRRVEKQFKSFFPMMTEIAGRMENIRNDIENGLVDYEEAFLVFRKALGIDSTKCVFIDKVECWRWKEKISEEMIPVDKRDDEDVCENFRIVVEKVIEINDAIVMRCSAEIKTEYGKSISRRDSSSKRNEIFWYNLAAEEGYAEAQYLLGYCYYHYLGVEYRDFDKAFSLYHKAAMQGHKYAMEELGHCYCNGRGTKKNFQKAGDFYRKACELGVNCKRNLDDLYISGKWDKNKYDPNIFSNPNNIICFDETFLEFVNQNREELEEFAEKENTQDLMVRANNINEQLCNKLVEQRCSECQDLTLLEKIDKLKTIAAIDETVARSMHSIRKLRNRVVHNPLGEALTIDEIQCVKGDVEVLLDFINKTNETAA